MTDTSPSHYGDLHAPSYDALFGGRDVGAPVDRLHELAGGGEALELGVGTGHFAIPLAARGVRVHGVDNSEAMLDVLRGKIGEAGDGDGRVIPTLADFTTVRVEAPISLVYCVFSSLFMLPDQDTQRRCLCNAAANLEMGGRLLLEMFVHDRTRFRNDQEVVALDIGDESAGFRVTVLEPNAQVLRIQKFTLASDGTTFLPNRLRFIYPSELDLMARCAGLEPESKWSDWNRGAFGASSDYLVAVYRKVAEGPF